MSDFRRVNAEESHSKLLYFFKTSKLTKHWISLHNFILSMQDVWYRWLWKGFTLGFNSNATRPVFHILKVLLNSHLYLDNNDLDRFGLRNNRYLNSDTRSEMSVFLWLASKISVAQDTASYVISEDSVHALCTCSNDWM